EVAHMRSEKRLGCQLLDARIKRPFQRGINLFEASFKRAPIGVSCGTTEPRDSQILRFRKCLPYCVRQMIGDVRNWGLRKPLAEHHMLAILQQLDISQIGFDERLT